jgi:UDPglucose 6-dehydrogenase
MHCGNFTRPLFFAWVLTKAPGTSTAAVLALKNPSALFTVVDSDGDRIRSWNSNEVPVQEPGLFEIILEVSGTHMVSNGSKELSSILGSDMNARAEERNSKPKSMQYTSMQATPCHAKTRAPNLHFSTDVRGAIAVADMIFITVNTPSKVNSYLSLCLC